MLLPALIRMNGSVPALRPSMTMMGVLVYWDWVVPSMFTGSVTSSSFEVGWKVNARGDAVYPPSVVGISKIDVSSFAG